MFLVKLYLNLMNACIDAVNVAASELSLSCEVLRILHLCYGVIRRFQSPETSSCLLGGAFHRTWCGTLYVLIN
jgi:hypothetical protein